MTDSARSSRARVHALGATAIARLVAAFEIGHAAAQRATPRIRTGELGAPFVFWPDDVPAERLDEFDLGRVQSLESGMTAVCAYLHDRLVETRGGVLVVEDALFGPSDPCRQRVGLPPWVSHAEAVDYFVTASESDPARIRSAIDQSNAVWSLNVLVGSSSSIDAFQDRRALDPALLAEVGATATIVAGVAYDGMGLVVCGPPPRAR